VLQTAIGVLLRKEVVDELNASADRAAATLRVSAFKTGSWVLNGSEISFFLDLAAVWMLLVFATRLVRNWARGVLSVLDAVYELAGPFGVPAFSPCFSNGCLCVVEAM
jgi:hypothetical protein